MAWYDGTHATGHGKLPEKKKAHAGLGRKLRASLEPIRDQKYSLRQRLRTRIPSQSTYKCSIWLFQLDIPAHKQPEHPKPARELNRTSGIYVGAECYYAPTTRLSLHGKNTMSPANDANAFRGYEKKSRRVLHQDGPEVRKWVLSESNKDRRMTKHETYLKRTKFTLLLCTKSLGSRSTYTQLLHKLLLPEA